MTLWSERVGAGLHPAVEEFLRADDAELLPYDCAATLAHARRLHAAAEGFIKLQALETELLAALAKGKATA